MTKAPQHLWILGCGASGVAAARLLMRRGMAVTVWDEGEDGGIQARADDLRQDGIRVETGAVHLPESTVDEVVVSPGIPSHHPWCRALNARGIPMISEVELGWRYRKGQVIAVTGSNGKSTVVSMIAYILERSGKRVAAGGNLGPPLCDIAERDIDFLVVEVSSFQLEWVNQFRPDVGIFLNLQPNHLDRHGDMAAYARSKGRLFSRTIPGDLCMVDSSVARSLPAESWGCGERILFGGGERGEAAYRAGVISMGGRPLADLDESPWDNSLHGPALVPVAVLLDRLGEDASRLKDLLAGFVPLPHRLEPVGDYGGVAFTDDSKATSMAAMRAALLWADRPVRLIAGGRLKERGLDSVADVLAEHVVEAYTIGESAEMMADAWSGAIPCRACFRLEDAFTAAAKDAKPGEMVLLSPGAASFDQFSGFAERGQAFQTCVERWKSSRNVESPKTCSGKAMDNFTGFGTIVPLGSENFI